MKASELIKKLQSCIDNIGDKEIVIHQEYNEDKEDDATDVVTVEVDNTNTYIWLTDY